MSKLTTTEKFNILLVMSAYRKLGKIDRLHGWALCNGFGDPPKVTRKPEDIVRMVDILENLGRLPAGARKETP
jgi:hypothetical protein